MSRDPSLFVDGMITACEKILRYVDRRSRSVFETDEQTFDAVLKNHEVIGEAAKRLSAEVKATHAEIAWRDIADLRDIIVHEYSGLDLDTCGTWSKTGCRRFSCSFGAYGAP